MLQIGVYRVEFEVQDNVQSAVTSDQLANYLLCESRYRGEILTQLKLQKLCYYAQAWWLALFDEQLVEEDFQAWVHGPVLPSQYARFRDYRWEPIADKIKRPVFDDALRSHLDEIVDVFGVETAVALERMTHEERPWLEARGDLPPHAPCRNVISKETMREYYSSLSGD